MNQNREQTEKGLQMAAVPMVAVLVAGLSALAALPMVPVAASLEVASDSSDVGVGAAWHSRACSASKTRSGKYTTYVTHFTVGVPLSFSVLAASR